MSDFVEIPVINGGDYENVIGRLTITKEMAKWMGVLGAKRMPFYMHYGVNVGTEEIYSIWISPVPAEPITNQKEN